MNESADDFPLAINSWADVSALIEHFSSFSAHDWLFRGSTESQYGLIPKIGRENTRATKRMPGGQRISRVPYRENDEAAVFSMFRQQALSHISRPPSTTLEWMALAQHFGVPTRLLDWTESFLVAVWFAVQNAGAKQDWVDSAVWVTRSVRSISAEDERNPFDIDTPHIYRPAHVSPRIPAQASVLMVCPNPQEEVNLPFVRKIIITRLSELTLKKRLNACGINKRSLFPDLQGLAEHLAWLHKNDYLAGYNGDQISIRSTPDAEDLINGAA